MSIGDTAWPAEAPSAAAFAQRYAQREARLLEALDVQAVDTIVRRLEEAYQHGRTIFCAGNGGSAATAAHLATDLAWGHRQGITEPPRVMSLTTNTPMLTAVGNDAGYAQIFVEQLRGLFQSGDVLVAMSASGNSSNILNALAYAGERAGVTIGFVGFDGGQMKAACDVCLHVRTAPGEYELVEDVHHAACHIVARYLKERIAQMTSAPELSI